MSITSSAILSFVAPLTAPAAPMILFGSGTYSAMIANGTGANLAMFGAIAGAVGTEATGALMCVMALEAVRRKNWGIFTIALGGAASYAGFVFGGIRTLPNAETFAWSVMISLLAYLALGIWQYFGRVDAAAEKLATSTTVQIDNQVALLQAQTEYTKAQAKLARAGQVSTVSSGVQSVSSVSSGRLDAAKLDAARKALAANPNITGRGMAASLSCSPMTGTKYLNAAKGTTK